MSLRSVDIFLSAVWHNTDRREHHKVRILVVLMYYVLIEDIGIECCETKTHVIAAS